MWKFIYVNCREWYEDVIDHCSYAQNLSSCEIKAWKNSGLNGIIITCILHVLRIYFKLTTWSAPSWPNSSVGKALHGYHRGHGTHSGLNFFRLQFHNCLSCVHNCDDQSYLHTLYSYLVDSITIKMDRVKDLLDDTFSLKTCIMYWGPFL